MTRATSIFVDMDDTLCDFSAAHHQSMQVAPAIEFPQSQPYFFRQLRPIPDAIDTLVWMQSITNIEAYILTAPSVKNPLCYTEKRLWVEDHLGTEWTNRLHISPRKDFFKGDLLIDDQLNGRGQEAFSGILIPFGASSFDNWKTLKAFLIRYIKNDLQLTQSERQDLLLAENNTDDKLRRLQSGEVNIDH